MQAPPRMRSHAANRVADMGTTVVLSRSLPGVGAPPTVRLASWKYSLPVSR
jgi:hypothetical protein